MTGRFRQMRSLDFGPQSFVRPIEVSELDAAIKNSTTTAAAGPDGRTLADIGAKAPLKPQQRLYALRVHVIPAIYHQAV